jgi:hypothetical protein
VAILVLSFSCTGEPVKVMEFPNDFEVINDGDSTLEICIECENKLVFYLDIAERSLYTFTDNILDWKAFSKEYPHVSVIVYLSGTDKKGKKTKEKMEAYLRNFGFPYQVFLDPEYQFYKVNNLENSFFKNNKGDQVFYVKGNEILGPANIGMPEARKEELDRYFGRD